MSKKKAEFKDVLNTLVELTNDVTCPRDIVAIIRERDNQLARLRDLEDLEEIHQFEELEDSLLEQEATFYGRLLVQRAVFQSALMRAKARGTREVQQHLDAYRQTILGASETIRDVEQLLGSLGKGDSAGEDEGASENENEGEHTQETGSDLTRVGFQSLKWSYRRIHNTDVKSLQYAIRSYTALIWRYRWRKIKRPLLRQSYRVFWSLVIFTLGLGILVSRIKPVYLSVVLIPILIWVLQETVFNRWLERRMLKIRRRQIVSAISRFHLDRVQARMMKSSSRLWLKSSFAAAEHEVRQDQIVAQ